MDESYIQIKIEHTTMNTSHYRLPTSYEDKSVRVSTRHRKSDCNATNNATREPRVLIDDLRVVTRAVRRTYTECT